MLIVLTIIAVFMLMTQASTYRTYTILNNLAYMDTMGCLGGFLCGVFSSWMMLPRTNNSKCQTNLRIVGTILTIVWFILWSVLFATG
jgi:hypothetical protein